MSYAIINIVYGVPLTEEVAAKMREWEEAGDERWFDDSDGKCGFEIQYSASGDSDTTGYCGVDLGELESYEATRVADLPKPTEEQKAEAEKLVAALDPELRALAGDIDTYFIWSDS